MTAGPVSNDRESELRFFSAPTFLYQTSTPVTSASSNRCLGGEKSLLVTGTVVGITWNNSKTVVCAYSDYNIKTDNRVLDVVLKL